LEDIGVGVQKAVVSAISPKSPSGFLPHELEALFIRKGFMLLEGYWYFVKLLLSI
jgi:hypothetical protein